jgi:multidrug efflux pump subunit AcrB
VCIPDVGLFFIIDAPIFNGLAISLIFGILISTLLTLVVISVVYYALKSGPSMITE